MKLNMTALRVAVLSSFVLSVSVTVWSMLSKHNHTLHLMHIVLATLTFLLIALYLLKSADIASMMVHRELRLRMTVDRSVGFIEYIGRGTPIFNSCAGALAKHGIFAGGAKAMSALAKARTVAAAGNSESREGYGATESTLAQMGVRLSGDTAECPVRMTLGAFDPDNEKQGDFVLTSDKVAHILIAVYVSRLYARYTLYSRLTLILALAGAATLVVFNLTMYSAAAIAVWSALEVILIRQIERKTTRLTFSKILDYCRR